MSHRERCAAWKNGDCDCDQNEPAPSAEPPAPGTALLCKDHTGTQYAWIERAELERVLKGFGLVIVPAAVVPSAPCPGCEAQREYAQSLSARYELQGQKLEAAKALIGRVKRTLDEAPRYDPDAKELDYAGIGAALACLEHACDLLKGHP